MRRSRRLDTPLTKRIIHLLRANVLWKMHHQSGKAPDPNVLYDAVPYIEEDTTGKLSVFSDRYDSAPTAQGRSLAFRNALLALLLAVDPLSRRSEAAKQQGIINTLWEKLLTKRAKQAELNLLYSPNTVTDQSLA